jgi:hypothetical protein
MKRKSNISANSESPHIEELRNEKTVSYSAAKCDFELSRLRRNFFDRITTINKIFLFSLYHEHPVYPV